MTRPPHVGRGEEEEGGGGPPALGQSRGVLHPRQSEARPGRAPLSHDAGGAGRREKPGRGRRGGSEPAAAARAGASLVPRHTHAVDARVQRLSRPAFPPISQLRGGA